MAFANEGLNKKSKIYVIQADKKLDVSKFKKTKNVELIKYKQTRPSRRLGSLGATNSLFEHQIIQAKKLNWDILEKDLFFMRLRDYKIPKLRKKYPNFSYSELKTLKESIK